eukprot:10409216-Prorocentrum_lima.AAC.1
MALVAGGSPRCRLHGNAALDGELVVSWRVLGVFCGQLPGRIAGACVLFNFVLGASQALPSPR